MVIGLIFYLLLVWELKIIGAQKSILKFLEIPPHMIKNSENKEFFRYAFYMSIFFDCIPQLAFKINYHYHMESWSQHCKRARTYNPPLRRLPIMDGVGAWAVYP